MLMMDQNKKLLPIIFFLSLFLFSFFCASQEIENKKIKLADALQEIEGQFDIKFSYIDENINTILIKPPIYTDHLSLILKEIEIQTQLIFEKLDDHYYSISKKTGQFACGKVVDQNTENGIFGVTIQATNNGDVIVTDLNGNFTLSNVKPETILRVRSLGYENHLINASSLFKTPCATIYLKPKLESLSEVVVHQFLTTGLNKQKDGNITINTKDFGILPGLIEPDVLQTIQALPGIESVNETVSNINIRGGTHDQNLVLWDDIKMYQSGHFFGLISAFNPYLTEKVSVIKNGTSALYGNGISGTIDMQSLNNIQDNFYGGAGLNLISGDIFAHIPIKEKFAIQMSARRSMTDFFKTPTYNQFYNRVFQDSKITNIQNQEIEENISRNENFFFYDAGLKLFYDLNKKHQFRGNLVLMNNNLEYNETLNDEGISETKMSTLNQQNFAFGAGVKSFWNNRFSTQINAYYTNYTLDADNFALLTDQRVLLNNEILETGIKLVADYKISNNLSLLSGYQFYEVGITNLEDVNNPEFHRKIKEVIRNHSGFSEIEYQSPSNTTFIRFGGRLNYIDKFDKFILEPRVNINQSLGGHFNLEVLGEMKSQITNQIIDLQRDFLGVEKRKWTLSNDKDLPITKSKQASLGVNFNKEGIYIGLEGFYKHVEGITTSNQGFQNQNQFLNRTSGDYEVKGAEFLINKKTSKYSTWLSYTFSKNNYTFESLNPQNFLNNLDIRHSLSFAGTYTLEKFKFALGLNWRTGKPYTQPVNGNEVSIENNGNLINYETPNSSTLPNYFRADFSSTYNFTIGNKKATAGIAVLNVLNRKNTLDIYYRLTDEQSTEVQQVENTSLGITPNASFRIFF